MPIVVKLSHAFYERFGDDVVSELVEVLNQVDATSQQSLRDLNEANWARFEDRLTRGLAELRAEIRGEIAALDAKLTAMLHTEIGRLEARLSAQLVAQMRWMIGIWGATLLAVMGLWFKR